MVIGKELKEMQEKMVNIMHNFKTTSDSQKGQVVEGKVVREFRIEGI